MKVKISIGFGNIKRKKLLLPKIKPVASFHFRVKALVHIWASDGQHVGFDCMQKAKLCGGKESNKYKIKIIRFDKITLMHVIKMKKRNHFKIGSLRSYVSEVPLLYYPKISWIWIA